MAETRTYPVRVGDREIKIELHHDPAYIPDLAAEKFAERLWEPELVRLMFRALKPGMSVVDAGANIGIFSLIMARLVRPGGIVDAFEPHPDTADRLGRNIALNGLFNIVPHEIALWDCRRDLTLHTFRDDPGMNSLKQFDGCAGSRTVQCDRLDKIIPPPHFIKLDIEGAEEKAMRGATDWLATNPLVACEYAQDHLVRFGTNRKNFADYMRGFGYDLWILSSKGEVPTLVSSEFDVQGGTPNLVVLFATKPQVSALWL